MAIIFVFYLLLWLIIPKHGFWGMDSGYKYQGARAFSNTAKLDIPYAGLSFDPDGSYRPLVPPYGVLQNDRQLPVFSVLFMVSAGILYWMFGSMGPFMLPLLGGWGSLIAGWFLWVKNRDNHDGRAFLLALGLGSPLMFYSLTLWEHSLSIIPVILAMAFVARRRKDLGALTIWEPFLSGVLIALATAFRTESVVWIPALLISWRWTGRKLNHILYFIFGLMIAIVVLLFFDKLLTDSFMPLHVASNVNLHFISSLKLLVITRFQNFYVLMIEGFDKNFWSVLGVVPLLLVVFWRAWRVKPRFWWSIFSLLIIIWLIFIANSMSNQNPVAYTSDSGGLLWITPFAVMGLMVARGEQRQFWWMIWSSSLLFILLIALASPMVHAVQWGPRLILQTVPFLLMLATARAQKWWKKYRPVRPIVIVLIIFSVLNQLYSVGLLYNKRSESVKLNDWAVVNNKEVAITDMPWLNGELGFVSDTRPSYYAKREDAIRSVVMGLRSQGYGKFHFFELPPYRDQAFWWKIGAEIMDTNYAVEIGDANAQIRRTTLKIIPGSATP